VTWDQLLVVEVELA